jgi:hypothetical protein
MHVIRMFDMVIIPIASVDREQQLFIFLSAGHEQCVQSADS